MNLKAFSIVLISFSLAFFPQNMIGCGPDIDYYDNYTSFFSRDLPSTNNNYKPFYYSPYSFLDLDSYQPKEAFEVISEEWAEHCGKKVSSSEAAIFLSSFSLKDLNTFYDQIESKQIKLVADSIKKNQMADYFLKGKDQAGLRYIIYAKSVEPYVSGDFDSWSPIVRDSLKMSGLISEGNELFGKTKGQFYKLKYGYQLARLAHYSKRYNDAIKFYDELIAGNPTKSILQNLSLALKAGALYHIGKNVESAYLFSKAFAGSEVKQISNFTCFSWAVGDAAASRDEFLALCKNNREKANLLAVFALGSTDIETNTINEIVKLDPMSDVIEVIAVREINKLEEKYFTPILSRQAGGKAFYYFWEDDSKPITGEQEVKELIITLNKIGSQPKVKNHALYTIGAAYCSVMIHDYISAKQLLDNAKKMNLSDKTLDQWMLTNILLSLNETDKISEKFENQLYPSIIWLKKMADDKGDEWKRFYRNIMSEVLAKRYHQQGLFAKEALAVGNAEFVFEKESNYIGVNFLHSNLESKEVEDLYNIVTSKTLSSFDKSLVNNNSISKDVIIDFAGTAYLRDHKYKEAIEWLAKSDIEKERIDKDPFIDLLYDREEYLPWNKNTTSKLEFAREMLRLQNYVTVARPDPSALYKMALGFYNTSYYGYAWELVEYSRSGSSYSFPDKFKNKFEKDYYSCFTAHDYFKLAMDASTDKNFKARCLFMMAKCAQKQVNFPSYFNYRNNYTAYEDAQKEAYKSFEGNIYFDQFIKDYSKTKFYKEALSSCSYLRDFVGKKKLK